MGRPAAAGALVGIVLVTLLAGIGWLYVLRGLGWLGAGPQVHDALPLLQLAQRDTQPLPRVLVAWLAAGLVAGGALLKLPRFRRTAAAGPLALALLLLASQGSFALTRNLNLGHELFTRVPGLGPWLEAGLFTLGCLLPGRLSRRA